MGFSDSVKTCFRKYFTFSGRASRPEYWWFFLFTILASIVAGILDGVFLGRASARIDPTGAMFESSGPLATIVTLGTIIPSMAAGWRRMHDSGRSGLFLLYPLIVLIGIGSFASLLGGFDAVSADNPQGLLVSASGLVLILAMFVFAISPLLVLWWLTRPSQPGPNAYGPNPHEVTP
ncbi:MAG: DUF805 domain-containing protein [Rhodobacteraceae bacterium]|nr:DUF805 domain-containing protein [Paracoccaceae bacterium]